MIGQTLSHFRITAKLGEGGMGEVYRAEDTKLGREVAIKVLPEAVAGDPERLARFEREAKVLASLNHNNIAAIYSLESSERADVGEGLRALPPDRVPTSAVSFLVMELVEGEDLSAHIAQGPIQLEQVLPIARQIAEALETAHERGVIHRDLKPANIKITPDGKVKVLDFGLAKALDPTAANVGEPLAGSREGASPSPTALSLSPTLTAQMTQAGVLLGTAAYMSPEQARGQEADKRADIWAFGVVLWEMLSGRQLFAGPTVSDTLAEVLKTDPDLEKLPVGTPAAVRRLLRRCLSRDPQQRLRDIGDARLELEETHLEDIPGSREVEKVSAPRWREQLAWLLAIIGIVSAAFLALRSAPPDPEAPATRFDITLPEDHRLAYVDEPILGLSPDGRSLAFVAVGPDSGQQMIYIRPLEQTAFRPVVGTEGGTNPTFSPDGQSLAFFADGQLKRISVAGGHAINMAPSGNPRGAVWGSDDTIYYSPEYVAGLWRIPASGGNPELLIEPDAESGERTYRWPDLLPDGQTVIFTVGTDRNPNNYDDAQIAAYSLDSGERRVLLEGATMGRFVRPDKLAFSRKGVLYLASLDLETLQIARDPTPALEGLGGDPSSGVAYFDVSSNGTLAYVSGAVSHTQAYLTLLDGEAESSRLPLEPRSFHHPRFSPDSSKIAFTISIGATGANGDVWIYELESQALSRISFGGTDLYPLFTPDGRWLTYLRGDGDLGIYRKPVDGSGAAELIAATGIDAALPESWSPDGETLAYTVVEAPPTVYLEQPGQEPRTFEVDASSPAFSPDGRWIAYQSPGSGLSTVFVRPVEGDGKWQVSPGVGGYPTWSGDGRKLYYLAIGDSSRPLMEVDIEPGDSFRAGPPRVLVDELAYRFTTATAPSTNWDASPANDRFVFVEFDRDESARVRIDLILNWAQSLK